MVIGYDHLLFLLGVLTGVSANPYMIDAVIGLSVVYKALDDIGAFQHWFGFQQNTKAATLIFGLFHGFGLATKILDFGMASDGMVPNLLAFNFGVEIGQLRAPWLVLANRGRDTVIVTLRTNGDYQELKRLP